ncbi:MAG: hypothetical protein ACREBS_09620 [Nitrososphaerales archaeon]
MQTEGTLCNRKTKQSTADSALMKIRQGFCLKSNLTRAETLYVRGNYSECATIKIESAGVRGARRYSIYDLVGHSVRGMIYFVIDHEKFSKYISRKLEDDFAMTNPEPTIPLRRSFTSFMHENKLHWSRCYCSLVDSRRAKTNFGGSFS